MQEQINIIKSGVFIRELRKEKEMTQKDLGEQVGVSDKAVSKWERGLSLPDIALLPNLAKVLDVSIEEILYGERHTSHIVNSDAVMEAVVKTVEYSQKSFFMKIPKIIFTIFLTLILPAGIICMIVDYADDQAINWSLYPIGAFMMITAVLRTGLFSRKNKLEATVLALFVSLSLYLSLISFLSGNSGWVIPVGVPITLICTATIYCIIKSFIQIKNVWYSFAILFFALFIGPIVLIHIVILLNGIHRQDASLPISIIFVIISAILYLIGRIKEYKETDHKLCQ